MLTLKVFSLLINGMKPEKNVTSTELNEEIKRVKQSLRRGEEVTLTIKKF